MQTYAGKIASKGIAIGPIREAKLSDQTVRRRHIDDIVAEKARFDQAQRDTIAKLQAIYHKAVQEVGEQSALIFEIHSEMVQDEDYVNAILNIIERQTVNAEYAVMVTGEHFAHTFANMADSYMKERAADIKDISSRLINTLQGHDEVLLRFDTPCILLADDLTPSQTVQMDKQQILGFITRKGSTNSHTAILSRTMAIPALVGVDVGEIAENTTGIVDGFEGNFTICPDDTTVKQAKKLLQKQAKTQQALLQFKGKQTITKSQQTIKLCANVGSIGDIGLALQQDAEGIGLFRTEFLYLEQQNFPDEELQFSVYKQAVEMMADKQVILRTLDIGADKQIGYFGLDAEENPALGYRAIRICLTREEIFITQLRALIRASAFGKIAVMVPMITAVWEVKQVLKLMQKVRTDLTANDIPIGTVQFGVMIETPAAVLIADQLAPMVDFFSIGTNDLTQYTLAIDRQNQALERFYDTHHPAILQMIADVAQVAKQHKIWVGICGELAADQTLTAFFLDYGIDELSVTPSQILPLRQHIRALE